MQVIGESISVDFTLCDPESGQEQDADLLPAGVLVVNGVDTDKTVTITHKTPSGTPTIYGLYTASVSAADTAGFTPGDRLQVRINATVNGITGNDNVLDDTFGLSNSSYFAAMSLALGTQVTVSSSIVNGDLTLYANAGASRTFTKGTSSDWPASLAAGQYEVIEFFAMIKNGNTKTHIKAGTGSVIVATGDGQQVKVVFSRDDVNSIKTVYQAAFTDDSLLNALNNKEATYAVVASKSDCSDSKVLAYGNLIIVDTPFDSTDAHCPISGT
ncbi:MAG: hypothetical protein U0872_14115 [Planctomycetaceae bacterium]